MATANNGGDGGDLDEDGDGDGQCEFDEDKIFTFFKARWHLDPQLHLFGQPGTQAIRGWPGLPH